MVRLAANLSMLFTELPFPDRIEAAARAGFGAVECQFPYDWAPAAIRSRLDRHGVSLVLHNLPAGNWAAGDRGIACHPDRTAEFDAGVEHAMQYATSLGCPRINCLAGVMPAGCDADTARRTLVRNLRHASMRLAASGIMLLLEAINTRDVPGFLVCNTSQAAAILDEVAAENLFIQFDAYHMHMMGEDPADTFRTYAASIRHIQIADAPGRHEPGTGTVDMAALFSSIEQAGYGGFIGCEYNPLNGTDAGLGWAARYLRPAHARKEST